MPDGLIEFLPAFFTYITQAGQKFPDFLPAGGGTLEAGDIGRLDYLGINGEKLISILSETLIGS
jgi:hypothetical protein